MSAELEPASTRRPGEPRRSLDCEKCGARMLVRKEVLCGRETERGRIVCREPVCVGCETRIARRWGPRGLDVCELAVRDGDVISSLGKRAGAAVKMVYVRYMPEWSDRGLVVVGEVRAVLDGLARVLGMVEGR